MTGRSGLCHTSAWMFAVILWVFLFLATLAIGRMRVGKAPAILMFVLYAVYLIYQFVAAFGVKITFCFSRANICV